MKVMPLPLTISHFFAFVVLIDCNKSQSMLGNFFSSGIKLVQSILKIREMGEEFIRADITYTHRHRYTHTYTHTYTQTRTHNTHRHVHTHIHTHTDSTMISKSHRDSIVISGELCIQFVPCIKHTVSIARSNHLMLLSK
jgi:hypothetical protein